MVVPRIIWSLWLQGWDSAPELVRACAASWSRLNPGWGMRRLTKAHVNQLFSNATLNAHLLGLGIPPEAISDVVRLELLARYGGVWADATTYCLAPLDEWLKSAVASGFFTFDSPGPGPNAIDVVPGCAGRIASHLAMARSHPSLLDSPRSRDAYFWVHYLFAKAYETDDEVRRVWDSTPKISANGPHSFAPSQVTLFGPVTDRARSMTPNGADPHAEAQP